MTQFEIMNGTFMNIQILLFLLLFSLLLLSFLLFSSSNKTNLSLNQQRTTTTHRFFPSTYDNNENLEFLPKISLFPTIIPPCCLNPKNTKISFNHFNSFHYFFLYYSINFGPFSFISP